jgi:predicted GIY-YIG superfamily endonuclease
MPRPFCVYILFSRKDKLLDTGFTTNIEARVKNHDEGNAKARHHEDRWNSPSVNSILFAADARKERCILKLQRERKQSNLCLATRCLDLATIGVLEFG